MFLTSNPEESIWNNIRAYMKFSNIFNSSLIRYQKGRILFKSCYNKQSRISKVCTLIFANFKVEFIPRINSVYSGLTTHCAKEGII